jgi:hypothetical protein
VVLAREELTEPERAVWDAMEAGTLVELPLGAPAAKDPAKGAKWRQDRQVRAQLLVELLTGRAGPKDARPRALKLAGARVTGTLDLEATILVCPLILQGCSFEEGVNLNEAQAPAVRLPGCHLPGLNAKQLETRGSLELDHGFTACSEVNLCGARIGGDLVFDGATISDPDGVALDASGLTVQHSMVCGDGFTAHGKVDVRGARIGGDLVFTGATLTNPNGYALMGAGASVSGAMICGQTLRYHGEGLTAQGEVDLDGAHIGGSLSFVGATLNNPDAVALAMRWLTVEQSLFCSDGFTAHGGVNMIGARIGDILVFTGATLINPNGLALVAPGVSVGGRMFCGSSPDSPAGFTAQGQIRLINAHIGGFLTFRGASLANPGGAALIASGLTVDQELFCGTELRAVGEVCLDYGRVKSLVCSGGTFTASDDGLALSAEGLVAAHEVRCADGFTAEGEVSFRGARIGAQLTFDGAALTSSNPDRSTLNLQELDAQVLILRPQAPPRHVDLTHAHVRVLVDPQAAWPQSLGLGDFAYDVLSEHPKIDVAARLAWLERDPRGYAPQPYEQLTAVYRRAGRDEDARRVAIAKQRRHRRDRHLPGRLWGMLLDGLVGYGYRTWLGGLWLLAFLLVGWVVFARAYPAHMTPANQPGVSLPHFQPFIYALDTLLPVIALQQQDNWIPSGLAQWWAWVSILAGWVLTAAVAAALTGLIKKE